MSDFGRKDTINAETANYITVVANSNIAVLTELLEEAEPDDELTITNGDSSVRVDVDSISYGSDQDQIKNLKEAFDIIMEHLNEDKRWVGGPKINGMDISGYVYDIVIPEEALTRAKELAGLK